MLRNHNNKILPGFFVLLIAFAFVRAGEPVRVVQNGQGETNITIDTNPPVVSTITLDGKTYSRITAAGFSESRRSGAYQLPFTSVTVHLNSKTARLKIVSSTRHRIPLQYPPVVFRDIPLGADSSLTAGNSSAPYDSIANEHNLAQLKYIGSFRGNHLWSVQVYPFSYDPDAGELIFYDDIVLQVKADADRQSITAPIPAEEQKVLQALRVFSAANKKQAARKSLHKAELSTTGKWKILVDRDGIYKITGKDLQAAGMRLFDVDIATLRLTANGRDVPVYVKGWKDGQFDENDYIEFWGEYNRQTLQHKAPDLYLDPYSRTNVYWLSWGGQKGQWMIDESGMPESSRIDQYRRPFSFLETIHVEKDGYFDRLSGWQSDSLRDYRFFDSGIGAGKMQEYPFQLYHPDPLSPLSVFVKVMLSGRTKEYTAPHHVSAFLDGNYISEQKWWGQNIAVLQSEETSPISGSDLKHEENVLTIVNNADPQSFDFIFLNWFEISYPRLYRAHENFIKFSVPPDQPSGYFVFKVDGFRSEKISVYKLNASKISGVRVEEVTDMDGFTSLQASFYDYVPSGDVEYVAVSENAKLKPDTIFVDVASQLKSPQLSADYVIISHRRFIDSQPIEDLVRLRQSQGYHVLKVDVQDIYDEFNAGKPSPYAVKSFLRWAYQNWQEPALQYVLLVGDGCYRRYASGDTLDLVPVYMRQTQKFGAAASDHWYTLVDGDDEIPDIHVGRLPVRTIEDLEKIVGKIVQYETNPAKGDWRNRLLLIGGNGSIFRQQVFALEQRLQPSIEARKLFTVKDRALKYDPFFGGSADLLDYFDQGCSIITFHGHGGGAIWADNGLMRLEDAARIYSEDKLPVIFSMTCFTGSFESPGRSNLADALLFVENKGAVAFMGASGVGWVYNDYYLLRSILDYLYRNPDQTIGEIIDGGKTAYYAQYPSWLARSEINQYHLLGDPAMRLKIPGQEINVALDSPLRAAGDQIQASARVPFERGTGFFSLVDSLNSPIFQNEVTVENKVAQTTFQIPEQFPWANGIIRFYGYDELDQQGFHGATPFSTNGIVFDSVRVIPAENDSLSIRVHVTALKEAFTVFCITAYDTLQMVRADEWYITLRKISEQVLRSSGTFSFYARMPDGKVFYSRPYHYESSIGVSLSIVYNSIKLIPSATTMLQVQVRNSGDSGANDVSVLFQRLDNTSDSWIDIGRDTIAVPAYGSAMARVPYSAPPLIEEIKVTVDPEQKTKDISVYDNALTARLKIDLFNYAADKGLVLGDQPVASLQFDEYLTLNVPAGAATRDGVLQVRPIANIIVMNQPDFRSLAQIPGYQIEFAGAKRVLQKPIQLSVSTAKLIVNEQIADLSFCRFDQRTSRWIRIATTVNDTFLTAQLYHPGQVALFRIQDASPPRIEVAVDGLGYVPDMLIAPDAEISLILQDENGVNVESDSLLLMLDYEELNSKDISLPDSILNANHIILQIKPQLSAGMHTLSAAIVDCNGNRTESEFNFLVAQDFSVKVLGNYPNPFDKETVFAYILTQPADKLSIKIYTASGRLIRNLDPRESGPDPNPLASDYHEATWDGTDDEGHTVANGVYFFKFVVSAGNKTREVVGKIAKIK